MPRRSAGFPLTSIVSLVLHGVVLWGAGVYALSRLEASRGPANAGTSATPSAIDAFEIALSDERFDIRLPEGTVPPKPAGGAAVARIDTGNAGHGGERAAVPAVNLSDRDEKIRLTTDTTSHLEEDEEQRLRTARERQSYNDRRSSREPMELVFLANGPGDLRERRQASTSDPRQGALLAPHASRGGGDVGTGKIAQEEDGPRPGSRESGSARVSPGLGVHGGREDDLRERASARLAHGRPMVERAAVSIAAFERGRPRDTVDSEQAVSMRVQSLVHASTAGGSFGEGEGGTSGGGPAGAGAFVGSGSVANLRGVGTGDWFDLDSTDPRFLGYFRGIHRKLDPLWANAFPKRAASELKQGMVILEFVIERDGRATLSWPPFRASGIDEFDENCATAVRRAGPFDAIPASLGVAQLRIRARFDARNSIIK